MVEIMINCTVVIPWIRKDKIGRAITAATINAGGEVLIYAKQDTEHIGCPQMVKDMVDQVQTDYVAFLADDSIAAPGYIKYALEEMSQFPDDCGLIGFNDKSGRFTENEMLANHWIAHIDLLPLIGNEFFHTGYTHAFCDNELYERLMKIGRYKCSELAVCLHDHPMISGVDWDDDYKRVYSQEVYEADKALFLQRRSEGWPDDDSQFLDTVGQ